MDENVTVRIEADTEPFVAALGELQQLSQGFGRQLTGALQGAVVSGRSLEDGRPRRLVAARLLWPYALYEA
jgi:hypothetical protein